MSTDPKEALARKIRSLQRDANDLQKEVRLATHRDRLEDLQTTVSGLAQRVQELRDRDYPFEKELMPKAEDLRDRWPALHDRVAQQVEAERRRLEIELRPVERQVQRVAALASDPNAAQPLLEQAERAVETFEQKAKAASDTIDGMYDQFEREVGDLQSRLQRLNWMLDQFAEATFRLLPGESGIMAVSAKWDKGGKDDPVGLLYLTDQRLLFEQKQDIATKKVLFITTEKKRVHKLLLQAPVGQVKEVRASKRGLMGHEDHIDVTFTADAAVPAAHFHLDGQDCELWQGLIHQAKAGDFDRERAVALDQELVERARQAPTSCPNCNAPITQQIVRGMDHIRCEYCGHVIRL
jgi:hypothetical protein